MGSKEKYEEWINAPIDVYTSKEGPMQDFSIEELSNPDFIVPEFESRLPNWVFTEELSKHIGDNCVCSDDTEGIFLGLSYTYIDYYYKIQKEDNTLIYCSCVSYIKFK